MSALSLIKISRSKRYAACSDVVEARRVELLSESTSAGTSPGADGYLHSLARVPAVRPAGLVAS